MRGLLASKFVKGGIWYTIGNILVKGMVFLSLPLFARILTKEEMGYYNSYMAYQLLIGALIGGGVSGCIKNGYSDYKEQYEEFVGNVIYMLVAMGGVGVLFANVVGFFISLPVNRVILNVLIVTCTASNIIDIFFEKWVIELKYRKYICAALVNSISNIVISVVLIKLLNNAYRYQARIFGESFAYLAVAMVIVVGFLWKRKYAIKWRYWKYAYRIGLPLVPHILSKNILVQFDRIMLPKMCGLEETAIYSCMYNISSIINVLLSSFNMVWVAWYYREKDKGKKLFSKVIYIYTLLFGLVTVLFLLLMPEILYIFVSKEYMVGIDAAFILTFVVYINFVYLFYVNCEFYYKKTYVSSICTGIAAISNIALNWIFIPLYGYMGAGIATVLSYIVLTLIHMFFVNIKYKEDKMPNMFLAMSVIIASCVFVLVYLISDYLYIRLIVMLVILIMVGLFIFSKKDKLHDFRSGERQ